MREKIIVSAMYQGKKNFNRLFALDDIELAKAIDLMTPQQFATAIPCWIQG